MKRLRLFIVLGCLLVVAASLGASYARARSVVTSFRQAGYLWRNDNGTEVTATSAATLNNPLSGALDTNYRLRIETELVGTGSVTLNPKLQYNKNGAGWNDVNGASSVARSTASPNVADNAATTQQINVGGPGTFGAGKFDEADGGFSTGVTLDDAGNDATEHECCIQIRSGDVAAGDVIQFRLVEVSGSAPYGEYTEIAVFTVGGGSGSDNFMPFFD